MKINTLSLKDALLDWALANHLGIALVDGCFFTKDPDDEQVLYSPSSNTAQAAEFIAEYGISITNVENFTHLQTDYPWLAHTLVNNKDVSAYGDTWTEAVCRCVLIIKSGMEIEIPDEVVKIKMAA